VSGKPGMHSSKRVLRPIRIGTCLSGDLLYQLDQFAEKRCWTRSRAIERVLHEYFEQVVKEGEDERQGNHRD